MRLKNDVEENMILDSINNMSSNEKELERLRRNVNLKELENKELVKKVTRLDMENHNLNQILEKLETYLLHRGEKIKRLNNDKEYDLAICEFQMLSDFLAVEKNKLLNKEVEDEKK